MRLSVLRLTTALTAVVALSLGSLLPADAIPVFARKYGFNCTMCHSNYPRLNDWGMRFRMNGYQIPGQESDEKTVLETSAPFAARVNFGYNREKFSNTPDATDVRHFQLNSLDLLSGGVLGRNLGYFAIYPPKLEGSSGVVAQPGTLEMANLVFSTLVSRWLNVRVGRFETAAPGFSDKRRLTVAPYEIYDFTFPGGPPLSQTQEGLELTGYRFGGFSYALGWVNGAEDNFVGDSPADFYARVQHVFGMGEGMTAGQRVGLMGYWGKARPADAPEAGRGSFQRYGIDASLNYDHANLALQYVQGSDDRLLWTDAPEDLDFSGGFAEFSYLPSPRWVGFARYDWVRTPEWLNSDLRRWTAGARYYPVDQLALHLEYSNRSQDPGPLPAAGRQKEQLLTARLDLAF